MLESLASLNNDGAKCIINNNYDGAISCFLETMRLTKQRLNEERFQNVEAEDVENNTSSPWTTGSTIQHTFWDVDDSSSSPTGSSPSSNGIFIFKKVFVITSCRDGGCSQDGSSSNDTSSSDVLMPSLMQLAII